MNFEAFKESVDNELFDRYHLSLVDLISRYGYDHTETELLGLFIHDYSVNDAVYDLYLSMFYGA